MSLVKRVKILAFLPIVLFSLNNAVSADEAVSRKILENGLTYLIKESPPKGLVSINVTVKAGLSSEEEYTASGISHLVEHMVFKGTKTRKLGDIENQIRAYGGFLNGAVSSDITTYSVTVPSKYLAETLAVLKDMLANAVFEKGELEKERDVILKEIKLNEDDPHKKLVASLFNNAYLKHAYKYPLVGYERLLKSLTRDDLLKYYNRIYVPNRIVISVVGDIDKVEAASKIEKEFKDFKTSDYRPINKEAEEAQIGQKSAVEEAGITLAYLALGYHSTSMLDKDLFALDVLSMILGRGDNSRLNNLLLKERRKVYSISSWNYTPEYPGLFVITALLSKDNIEDAKQLILAEIKKIKEADIADKEIDSAKRMVVSDYIMSRETIEEQAKEMAENEALTGNYDFWRRYVEGIQKVNKLDIRRVASIYLREDNLTDVRLVPREAALLQVRIPKSAFEDKIEKCTLANGLRMLARRDTKIPAFSVTAAFSGGLIVENANNNGISSFTSRMLLDGTKERSETDIKGAIETLGGEISTFSGFNSFGINVTALKGDLDFALGLIKDVIADSVFPQNQMDIEKSLTFAGIKNEDDDIFQKGILLLRKNLFEGYPYGMRDMGEEETVKRFTRDDIIKFYESYCVPDNTVISISGDIEPATVFKKIDELFKDIPRKDTPVAPAVKLSTLGKINRKTFEMDREETLLLLGFRTVGINNPDKYPLEVLEAILSGGSGRLFTELRDKASLAYTLGCAQKIGRDTGYILFYIATTLDKLPQAQKALLEQLKNTRQIPVSDDELSWAKRELILNHNVMIQTNSFFSLSSALDELYGLGYDNMYKYETNIKAVTKEALKKAADKYLTQDAYTEVIVKPQSS